MSGNKDDTVQQLQAKLATQNALVKVLKENRNRKHSASSAQATLRQIIDSDDSSLDEKEHALEELAIALNNFRVKSPSGSHFSHRFIASFPAKSSCFFAPLYTNSASSNCTQNENPILDSVGSSSFGTSDD